MSNINKLCSCVKIGASFCNIVDPVALEQTGLARIINAEGEKIQGVVLNGTIEKMMEVNASVQSMLSTISALAVVLQSKLSLFGDCLCLPPPCTPLIDTTFILSNKVTVSLGTVIEYALSHFVGHHF